MISNNVNIQDYYWGLQNKFILEVGLENLINDKYPEIIWFPQGLYIITGFSTSATVNNCTITIQGKDKMCLLNGDMGGNLPSQIDFGIEEYYNVEENVTYYNPIPLKDIIKNAVNVYGNEPLENIIINDLDMVGLEQLKYKGEKPLYLIRDISTGVYINMTLNGDMVVYNNPECSGDGIKMSQLVYNADVPVKDGAGTTIYFKGKNDLVSSYNVFKAVYGTEVGYRPTDLTYAGELIANVGETLVSVLDKIKNMLGNFEYFYDLEGRFIFQQKKTYVNDPWNSLRKEGNDVYATDAAYTSAIVYNFNDLGYFTAISHNPAFNNLKNDFSVWGKRKGITGTEILIHMRCALDKKPVYYKNYLGEVYISKDYSEILPNGVCLQKENQTNAITVDWREIIYQMSKDYYNHHDEDDFLKNIIVNNYDTANEINRYPSGYTGYETYYVDLYSFWRDIYDTRIVKADFPDKDAQYYVLNQKGDTYIDSNKAELTTPLIKIKDLREISKSEDIYIKDAGEYKKIEFKEDYKPDDDKSINDYLIKTKTIYSEIGLMDEEKFYEKYQKDKYYYYIDGKYELCKDKSDYNKYRIYYKQSVFEEDQYISLNPYYFTQNAYYPYNSDCNINTGESFAMQESPESLNFWFDLIGEGSAMEKYMACNIGSRTKAVNDQDVTGIYFQEVPDVLFMTSEEYNAITNKEQQTGYTYIHINDALSGCFTVSSQGKTAYSVLEKLLEENTYCVENVTITSIPIYYLEPNARIEIQDKNSGIEGEYLISKITLPLTYNGTMSITATKAVDTIY